MVRATKKIDEVFNHLKKWQVLDDLTPNEVNYVKFLLRQIAVEAVCDIKTEISDTLIKFVGGTDEPNSN